MRVVVAADGAIEETVIQGASGLSWRLAVKGVKTEQVAVTQRTAGFTAEAPGLRRRGRAPAGAATVGKRVSFEFKDIDIQNLLRVIAEISKKNIVVADDVQRQGDHPPAQRALGPGAGPHPAHQGPGQGGDGQHHPRRAAEDAGGGGQAARRSARRRCRRRRTCWSA